MLDLPAGITACLFDLDGVVTQTAKVHAEAWKTMFDEFLQARAGGPGHDVQPFTDQDYNDHVDGKPRLDGVRDFLASRGIELPEGNADDPPDARTVNGLGTRKNALVLQLIEERGVQVYDGSIAFLRAARDQGLRRAVVTSSANCQAVLKAAGIEDLFEARIDGTTLVAEHLKGKPAPDTFLAGARALGVEPGAAVVFEDALAGVEAGRAGHFGWVVGVDRVGHAAALAEHGADIVVQDLAELMEAKG
jgi:beta-phosphoglucomutase family hydrolase